uniref:Uncharacterized protein n=1 Tax=Anguilla anguilla TaxID=7936 RepID=A0A0E9T5K9_ANGAN
MCVCNFSEMCVCVCVCERERPGDRLYVRLLNSVRFLCICICTFVCAHMFAFIR